MNLLFATIDSEVTKMQDDKNYETVQEAAERMGVTVRAVQKWAANGKIPGAVKFGRSWKIPKETKTPEADNKASSGIPDVYQITPFRLAMPLLNSCYPVGKCIEYINSMPDPDDRNIALGEYFFFAGRGEEAAQITEPYLDSHDPALRFSASLICTFANLTRGHSHLARFAMSNLQEQVRRGLHSDAPKEFHAIGIFTATAASVLLHLPLPQIPPLEEYLKYLPGGLRMYGCYILAHKAYLDGDYSRCLTFADAGIALSMEVYPIACIYSHVIAAVALMNMRKPSEAAQRMAEAWKLAQPDDLIQPFGEHHGLLQGLIEIFFKKDYPKEYDRIIAVTYAFSATWREIHNPDTNHDVADNLSTMEFTIAMLYTRGWSYKEIAGHLQISERSVSTKVSDVFAKTGVNNRTDLKKFMLK